MNRPYNIVITFNNDPCTEMNLLWNTRGDNTSIETTLKYWESGKSSYVISAKGNSYVREGFVYHPHHGLGRPETVPPVLPEHIEIFTVHKVELKGLVPDAAYEYEIIANGNIKGRFKTGKSKGCFTFLYLSDAQAYSDKNFAAFRRTTEAALKRAPESGFFVMPGDMIDIGNSEELWRKFFLSGQEITQNYPIVPAIGNHETDLYSPTFCDHFNFPKNESPNLPDYVYTFDYGEARFVVLSTELWHSQLYTEDGVQKDEPAAFISGQLELLRNVFTDCDKWKIVVMHKALYTSGPYTGHSGTLMYNKIFEPLFDELGVNVVLQGHDHTFVKAFVRNKKAAPLIDDTAAKAEDGTFYLLSNASGEKFYDPVPESEALPLLKCGQPRTQMYTVVHVTARSIRFETYALADESEYLYDLFEIKR